MRLHSFFIIVIFMSSLPLSSLERTCCQMKNQNDAPAHSSGTALTTVVLIEVGYCCTRRADGTSLFRQIGLQEIFILPNIAALCLYASPGPPLSPSALLRSQFLHAWDSSSACHICRWIFTSCSSSLQSCHPKCSIVHPEEGLCTSSL